LKVSAASTYPVSIWSLFWPFSVHTIFTLLLIPLAIEAIAAANPPVLDFGYALHQATISPVKPTQRPQI
jgi:hypothetical protein